jgi:hypothetical protein
MTTKRIPRKKKCPRCKGQGYLVEAGHASGCDGGSRCSSTCPEQIQVQCPKCTPPFWPIERLPDRTRKQTGELPF